MSPKPPLYRQETEYSCAPACLRMVLAVRGIHKTEQELRDLCDSTTLGTYSLGLIEAARKLGFLNSRKYNLTLAELKEQLERGLFPIVYIRTRLTPDSLPQEHAVVVIEVATSHVRLLDPVREEIMESLENFSTQWKLMRHLTILVE